MRILLAAALAIVPNTHWSGSSGSSSSSSSGLNEASTEKASSRGPMAKLARYNDAWTKKCFLDCSGKRKHPSIKGNSGRRPMWWAPAFSWANQCRYPHHLDEATPARLTFRTGDRSSRPVLEYSYQSVCVYALALGKRPF